VHVRPRRSAPAVLATAATLVVAALGAGGLTAAPASADLPAAEARGMSLFPSDDLTVADPGQLTGRRVALPTAGCSTPSTCGLLERVNQLDGFDLDPRLAVTFNRDVDPAVAAAAMTLTQVDGGPGHQVTGVDRVVYDPATHTVYAHPAQQLLPGTTYRFQVARGQGVPSVQSRFTTLSATDGLLDLRRQLDSAAAYRAAGIPPKDRGLQIDGTFPLAGSTLQQLQDRGPAGAAAAAAAGLPVENGLVVTTVPNLAAGTIVFGSYLAPTWLRADRTIEQTPTADGGPKALRDVRLPFVLVLPDGAAPAGGWPTAIFGHGFTRNDGDVLLAAATASRTGAATIATDVVGHGYGAGTKWRVSSAGTSTVLPAYARGVDLDGNGAIDSTEGSGTLPGSPAAAVGSRDGLRQTAADNMALLRAVQRGLDVDGAPGSELRQTAVTYFGQSFGGIYGTMLAGADPQVARAALNVAGGPITEIARLSPAFRPLTTQALKAAGLLNSTDPDKAFFDESLPLRGQPPVTHPVPGALAIQDYLATSTWLTRPGSPETFAPLVPDARALFQVAFGDQTVPNPTAYTVLSAGGLFDRASLYRNDKTVTALSNPHGFLLNPTFGTSFAQAQAQVVAFLLTGQTIDPDALGPVWEVPIADPATLLPLNYTSKAFPKG